MDNENMIFKHNSMPLDGSRPALNPRQRAFSTEYVRLHLNATKAAISAGYAPSSAAGMGCRLLKDDRVRFLIDEEMSRVEREKKPETRFQTLETTSLIANADIGDCFDENNELKSFKDMPEHVRKSIQSVTLTPTKYGMRMNIRQYDKQKSLELLAKYNHILEQEAKVEINVNVLTHEEKQAKIQEFIDKRDES